MRTLEKLSPGTFLELKLELPSSSHPGLSMPLAKSFTQRITYGRKIFPLDMEFVLWILQNKTECGLTSLGRCSRKIHVYLPIDGLNRKID